MKRVAVLDPYPPLNALANQEAVLEFWNGKWQAVRSESYF
jgi:hypothetical protein